MREIELEFMFDDMPVGTFKEPDDPRLPGRYKYEPYRGPGHYDMCRRLRAGEKARCYYDCDEARVSFFVNDIPEYGVLELSDFQVSQPGP
jgi:hypothetical protein